MHTQEGNSVKIRVSKIEAARRQLIEVINLFFEERDPVAVHTLVAASLNILHDHFDTDAAWASNLMLHPESIYIKKEYRKKWITLTRDAINFFKHADFDLKKGRGEIEFEIDINIFYIFEAIQCLRILEGIKFEDSPEFKIFMIWFALKYPEFIKDNNYIKKLRDTDIDFNDFAFFRSAIQNLREHPELASQAFWPLK